MVDRERSSVEDEGKEIRLGVKVGTVTVINQTGHANHPMPNRLPLMTMVWEAIEKR